MALAELESIWIECARALDLPIARGGDAYVHFDGRTLHVADDSTLDEDDSLAQLVLHEICHLLVQGPHNRNVRDWGLDNTGTEQMAGDAIRERAAVRLQAHLAGRFGLRHAFFPTTIVRPYYEALPLRALDDAHDPESAGLAREAATRAGHAPYRWALSTALDATAAMLRLERHRSGGQRAEVTCGTCAWRAPSGLCRAADRKVFVKADEQGCTRHDGALDCLACGACCRSGYDAVPVGAREPFVARHPALVVARDRSFDLRRKDVGGEDRCVALDGEAAGPYCCSVYADRPRACADLPTGSDACLQARRRVGLS